MSERHGLEWWQNKVPKKIKDDVEKLVAKEQKTSFFQVALILK